MICYLRELFTPFFCLMDRAGEKGMDMRNKALSRSGIILSWILCALILADQSTAYALLRPRPVRRPVVVGPKVVVAPTAKPKVVTVHTTWPAEVITQEEITPAEMKKRNIKPEYGLIDFEVYPYNTKIYLDGDYKGYARTLNKDKYSIKARKGKHVIEFEKSNAPRKVIHIDVTEGYKTVIKQD